MFFLPDFSPACRTKKTSAVGTVNEGHEWVIQGESRRHVLDDVISCDRLVGHGVGLLIRDGGRRPLARGTPAAGRRGTECRLRGADEDAPQFGLQAGEIRSVLRSVRRLEPEPAPRRSSPTVDRAILAARPLPVAPGVANAHTGSGSDLAQRSFSTRSAPVAAARSLIHVGRPQLSLACQAPRAADLGEQVRYRLVVRNTGDGIAEQVVVEPQTVAGADSRTSIPRWFPIGDLAPGRRARSSCAMLPAERNRCRSGSLPRTAMGPKRRRECRSRCDAPPWKSPLSVPTPSPWGTRPCSRSVRRTRAPAAAEPVRVACSVGDGLRLTVEDQQVQFATKPGQLIWAIGRLAGGETKILRFQARPLIAGEQLIRVAVENAAGESAGIRVRPPPRKRSRSETAPPTSEPPACDGSRLGKSSGHLLLWMP